MKTNSHRLLFVVLCMHALLAVPAVAQPTRVDEPPGMTLDRAAMRSELQRLATICDSLGLAEEARISRTWLPPERPDQRTLYLPGDAFPTGASNKNQAYWQDYFAEDRKRFAGYLFDQAKQLAGQQEEAEAFALLWQVLREDPTHADAKRILGPLAAAPRDRPKISLATTPHPQFGWPARSYSRVQTPHFNLWTRADRRESVQLAQQLEEFYALWSQLFYDLWAAPGVLSRQFDAPKPSAWESRAFEVVLLRDRAEYLQLLGVAESNIGVSVGYYAPQAKQSLFYPSESLTATLQHELTHQLLAEATHIDVRDTSGGEGGFWMLEGIAMYMESLIKQEDYWLVGGFESPRMQSARYRGVRDGYWPSWSTFCTGSGEGWKSDPQVALLYTHAVGLTHVFMDQLQPLEESREAYQRAMVSVYQAEANTLGLLESLGNAEEQAKTRYQELLKATDRDMQHLAMSGRFVEELVLAGSDLSAQSWASLVRQRNLTWLDVSFSNVTTEDLSWLAELQDLRRLSIEGTRVDTAILDEIAKLSRLEELDLSGCAVDDAGLEKLRGNSSIKTLWLTGTSVSDACLETLAGMRGLRQCDIQSTQISEPAWQQFVRRRGW